MNIVEESLGKIGFGKLTRTKVLDIVNNPQKYLAYDGLELSIIRFQLILSIWDDDFDKNGKDQLLYRKICDTCELMKKEVEKKYIVKYGALPNGM